MTCTFCKENFTVDDRYITVEICINKLVTNEQVAPLYADTILDICMKCYEKLEIKNTDKLTKYIRQHAKKRFDQYTTDYSRRHIPIIGKDFELYFYDVETGDYNKDGNI